MSELKYSHIHKLVRPFLKIIWSAGQLFCRLSFCMLFWRISGNIHHTRHLPINAQHSDDSHCCKLVADIHHHHRFAHKVSEDPLSVSDQLMDGEGHNEQEQRVCYCQVQHVHVWYHFLLACRHRIDDQSIGNNSHCAQDSVNRREYMHESCDVDVAVRRRGWVQTWKVSQVGCVVVFT